MTEKNALKKTPLHALHQELGARLVPFAGYEMPVQYPSGILAEHTQTRESATLFDVSHMGQARTADAEGLERLVVGDMAGLAEGRQTYTLFTNDKGGILDDLMVTRIDGALVLVVNAARKDHDFALMKGGLADLEILSDRALLALQGPKAGAVMARLAPESAEMIFMTGRVLDVAGIVCTVTRSGYTGEDGFEISVPSHQAEALARRLLAEPEVEAAGLGARDSLRLEAGLCLYGSDIDETTTPIEAGLLWAVPKERRESGGFPGASVLKDQLAQGVTRKRVGLKGLGRAPARAHTEITDGNRVIGEITSGGPSPTLGFPIAMGYVETAFSKLGTRLSLMVRGKAVDAEVVKMPFVQHRYHRG